MIEAVYQIQAIKIQVYEKRKWSKYVRLIRWKRTNITRKHARWERGHITFIQYVHFFNTRKFSVVHVNPIQGTLAVHLESAPSHWHCVDYHLPSVVSRPMFCWNKSDYFIASNVNDIPSNLINLNYQNYGLRSLSYALISVKNMMFILWSLRWHVQ